MLNFVNRARPTMVTLENVHWRGDEGAEADYVCKSMEAFEYWCKGFEFDAKDYGSRATRARTYWQAVQSLRGHKTLFHSMFRMLVSMRFNTTPFGMDCFVIDADERAAFKAAHGLDAVLDEKSINYVDPTYMDEHNEFYRTCGRAWPPVLVNDGIASYSGMSKRVRELVHLVNVQFPFSRQDSDEAGGIGFEFLDAHPPLSRLLRCTPSNMKQPDEWHNPWTRHVPSIVGSAQIVVRRVRFTDKAYKLFEVRLLEGFEMMNFVGFDVSFYARGQGLKGIPLGSLAGNAFSGFACGPFALLVFFAYGASPVESAADDLNPLLVASDSEDGEHCGSQDL